MVVLSMYGYWWWLFYTVKQRKTSTSALQREKPTNRTVQVKVRTAHWTTLSVLATLRIYSYATVRTGNVQDIFSISSFFLLAHSYSPVAVAHELIEVWN